MQKLKDDTTYKTTDCNVAVGVQDKGLEISTCEYRREIKTKKKEKRTCPNCNHVF